MDDEKLQEFYKEEKLHVMEALLQSEKFKQFFALNYDVHRVIDDDAKEIRTQIIEVPPQEVAKRMQAAMEKEAKDKKPLIYT